MAGGMYGIAGTESLGLVARNWPVSEVRVCCTQRGSLLYICNSVSSSNKNVGGRVEGW